MTDLADAQMPNPEVGDEFELASYLADHVISRASGRGSDECLFAFPRDRYFVGNLRPAGEALDPHEQDAFQAQMNELVNKLSPVAFGAEFRVDALNDQFKACVELSWSCYYRAFPTYKQQLAHQSGKGTLEESSPPADHLHKPGTAQEEMRPQGDDDASPAGVDPDLELSSADRASIRQPKDSLFIRFKKIPAKASGCITLRREGNEWIGDLEELDAALQSEWIRVVNEARQDDDRLRINGPLNNQVQIPNHVMDSEESFIRYLDELSEEVPLEWHWNLSAQVRRETPGTGHSILELMITFTNASLMPEDSPNIEPFLFEPRASFIFEGCEVLPFEVELAPAGFRYDRNIAARGFNCGVDVVFDELSPIYVTANVPSYQQPRYVTRTSPEARFDDLANEPLPVLRRVESAMAEYFDVWDEWKHIHAGGSHWESSYELEFANARRTFEDEIHRFHRGVDLIETDPDINLAFRLTNATFARTEKKSWRLFQLVFLLSQLGGIAALNTDDEDAISDREFVDIIYFPTGGGKTEAYLATIVFHCFFDRLRGKKTGVTAWTRFPLRLLTIQQTQRAAEIIGMADLVRGDQLGEPRLTGQDVSGFAVGYFVGQSATPNQIVAPFREDEPSPEWSMANDESARQAWKRVYRCPACRTNTIQVDFDAASSQLIHRCVNEDCLFPQGRLPVYVVDMEIYRYLPCLIVGTIDKLAGVGNQRKLSLVFGKIDGLCSVHGYYVGNKCTQMDCRDPKRLTKGSPHGFSGPTLFVQDELHLIKEGLGTFDSHYETFVQRLMQEFGASQPIKLIASSATVEAFERQVSHLYGRARDKARVFPGLGPALGESFYATTLAIPQRVFMGIIPHNKTLFNAILEVIQYYHEAVQDLLNLPAGGNSPWDGEIAPGSSGWRSLLDNVTTSLTYFRKTLELSSTKTDVLSAVNFELQNAAYRPLEVVDLTGSTPTDEVAEVLEKLETPFMAPGDAPDVVLATSMISHGVDIDRLNAMIFYGMPLQVAEYIQASSRVGRAHVGLVLMCLHPARERDQSIYEYFTKFHEFLGQLIEPVAINRWSRFSADRTLPGLFMAILLQVIANGPTSDNPGLYYRAEHVKRKIQAGEIRADDFIPILEAAYLVNEETGLEPNPFEDDIAARVGNHLDQILGAAAHIGWVSEALYPRPMTSLRDVDEQLAITLDEIGRRWSMTD